MTPGPQVAQDQELFRLGHRLDQLDNEARKYNRLSQERVAIEDERMKVWTRFRVLYEKLKGIREDHGMGYGHNVSTPGDQNTMNKPTVGLCMSMKNQKHGNQLFNLEILMTH